MRKTLAIGLCAAFPLITVADTFDSAVNQILDGLTNIQTLDRGYESRITALEAENSLPGAEASFAYKWPQQSSAENRWGIEVSQSFDWPGAYRTRKRVASELRRLKGETADAARQSLRFEIESTLLQLIEARQRRELLAEAVDNLADVTEKTRTLLERGRVTVLDFRKAEFDLLELKERLTRAEIDCERFRALAGFGQVLPSVVDSLTEFPTTLMTVPTLTAEQIELQADAAIGLLDEQLERTKRFPSFSVGYLHDFEEGVHFNGLSVGISLPAYRAAKSATAARLEAETAKMKFQESVAAREAELKALSAEASRLDALIADYQRVLADNDYLRLLRKSFDAGQITVDQLLLDQNRYLSVRIDFLELRLRRLLIGKKF